ncbi:hypothetical protein Tco_0104568 [Tanacetum coccineum]
MFTLNDRHLTYQRTYNRSGTLPFLASLPSVDEEILTNELSNLEEVDLSEDNEIAEVFRIETNVFLLETPLSKEFKEFNHLLQIDVDVLTRDLPRFNTYEDYKNAWIYEWNIEVSSITDLLKRMKFSSHVVY